MKLLGGLEESNTFPPIYVEYFTRSTWNTGVFYAKLSQHDTAEKWMSLALSFVKKLKNAEKMEAVMSQNYATLLKQLQLKRPPLQNVNKKPASTSSLPPSSVAIVDLSMFNEDSM